MRGRKGRKDGLVDVQLVQPRSHVLVRYRECGTGENNSLARSTAPVAATAWIVIGRKRDRVRRGGGELS